MKYSMRHSLIALLLAGLLAACTPVDVLNATVPRAGYHIEHNIAYGRDPRQKLDIYLPATVGKKTPVVVFFYGGSWNSGEKDDYLFAAEGLTSLGYIVAIPDYRVYPSVQYPEFLRDGAKAVTWVYKHIGDYGGNGENLYLIGHSAGAYNAVMLALNERYLEQAGGRAGWIRGVVGVSGPYDFLPLTDPDVAVVFASEKDLPKTQPITYARMHAPPMLLLTGTADDTVNPDNSRHMYQALKGQGNDVVYKEYDGIGHKAMVLGLTDSLVSKGFLKQDIAQFIASH